MMFFNWIKSYFVKSNEINQDSYNHISTPVEPPYSLLTNSSLSIKDVQKIQEIIEEYGQNFKENNDKEKIIQDAYTQLFSISSEDENIRLYLHELMLFTSIRMNIADFYVELSKTIIAKHQHLLSFVKSQIFWCFDNFADLFVYLSISKKILEEKDLQPFEKSLIFDMSFYFTTDNMDYNPFRSYMRFLYLNEKTDLNFHYSNLEIFYESIKIELKKSTYQKVMRSCLNMDEMAIAIRDDNDKLIGTNNGRIKLSLIDRNEMAMFGCSFLQYSAFYNSKKCFKKLATELNFEEERKYQIDNNKNQYYLANKKFVLSDFAACGGDIEICKIVLENGIHFTSQSLLCAIRYHRFDVFNWLINDLNIKMDEECIKASFQYEFVPAIEMYDSKINVNLELSKSGNYVIFSKFIRLDSVNLSNQNNRKKEYKYAQLMPIFLYNSVDCVRFILSKNLDLNECSWFDSSGARFEMFTPQYRNPFHIAIKHQYFDLIYMILNYTKIDLNKLEYLVSSGGLATLGFSAEKKLTPLEISIYTDNSDIVNLILSLDQIDVNKICYSCYIYGHSKNTNNLSIFYAAALHENLEILEIILKSKRIDTKVKSQCKKIDTGYTVYRNVELDVDILKDIKNKNVFNILSKYEIK